MKAMTNRNFIVVVVLWLVLVTYQAVRFVKIGSDASDAFCGFVITATLLLYVWLQVRTFEKTRSNNRNAGFISILSHDNHKPISHIERGDYLDKTYPGLPRYIQSEMLYRHFTIPEGIIFDRPHLQTSDRRIIYPGSTVKLFEKGTIITDRYITHNDLFVLFLFRHNLPYVGYNPSFFVRRIIDLEQKGIPYEITF